MLSTLDSKIADVATLRVCRYCSKAVPADAIICECRIARGETPHTEWPRELKRLLCVRMVESRMWRGTSEHEFWSRMLTGVYAGTTQGEGRNRIILPFNASPVDCYPYAVGDASLWAAAGYPTSFHI